jgi:uncharacterized iron-regulated membrane protein
MQIHSTMMINRVRVRQLHRWLAPVTTLPLLLTLLTGMGYEVAISTGNVSAFRWMMELHRGKFGPVDLTWVYPFLNGLGLLTLVISGGLMWMQSRRRSRS